MSGWPRVTLREAINRIVGGKNVEAGRGLSPYRILKVSAVTSGYFRPDEAKPAPDDHRPLPEHHIRKGDFLFTRANTSALVGAVAIVNEDHSGLLLPDKIWRIEWRRELIEPRFAYFLLRSTGVRRVFAQVASGTSDSMKNISQGKLLSLEASVPPLEEQRRIVSLLDRAADIRRRADAAGAKARAIIPALFLDMFGDPLINAKGWPSEALGKHISLIGGGTPSKTKSEFWNGNIPWVSPKDMKPPAIVDSEDKITDSAMASCAVRLIPSGNVLIVVRGMILAHTVPIRMNSVAVTVNQDMKALLPRNQLNATFLRWMLQVAHGYLLEKVRESAHGTKKLETPTLTAFPTILPPLSMQRSFEQQVQRIEGISNVLDAAAHKAKAMSAALSAEVFT